MQSCTRTPPQCQMPTTVPLQAIGAARGEKCLLGAAPPGPNSSEQHLCSLSTHRSKGLPYFTSTAPPIQAGSKTLEHKAENICHLPFFFLENPHHKGRRPGLLCPDSRVVPSQGLLPITETKHG